MIIRSISGVRGTIPEFNSEAIQQFAKDGLIINLTRSIFARCTI